MQIEIIGAGAVGLLVASYLVEGKATVRFITKVEEKAQQLRGYPLTRTNIDETTTRFLVQSATTLSDEANLIIIAVKYGQLQQVFTQLQQVNPSIPLLFLQNGLAHYEEALMLPQQHIAFSAVQFGAQKLNDIHVAHKGHGVMKVAVARGDSHVFSFLRDFSLVNFPIVFERDAEAMLLEKALLNCFINPLTAILKVKNGQLIVQNNAFQIVKNLYNEIITTFPQYAETFQFEQVVSLCEKTAHNTSSMLADRLAGRETEIETIVGAILKKAYAKNMQMPILQTLYMLVKAFEESGEKM